MFNLASQNITQTFDRNTIKDVIEEEIEQSARVIVSNVIVQPGNLEDASTSEEKVLIKDALISSTINKQYSSFADIAESNLGIGQIKVSHKTNETIHIQSKMKSEYQAVDTAVDHPSTTTGLFKAWQQ